MKKEKKINKKMKIEQVHTAGFSLIEAMISLMLVGIILLPISSMFMNSFYRIIDTREQTTANAMAQEYIEYFKGLSYDEMNLLSAYAEKNTDYISSSNYNNYTGFATDELAKTRLHGSSLPKVVDDYEVRFKLIDIGEDGYNTATLSKDIYGTDIYEKSMRENADIIIQLDTNDNDNYSYKVKKRTATNYITYTIGSRSNKYIDVTYNSNQTITISSPGNTVTLGSMGTLHRIVYIEVPKKNIANEHRFGLHNRAKTKVRIYNGETDAAAVGAKNVNVLVKEHISRYIDPKVTIERGSGIVYEDIDINKGDIYLEFQNNPYKNNGVYYKLFQRPTDKQGQVNQVYAYNYTFTNRIHAGKNEKKHVNLETIPSPEITVTYEENTNGTKTKTDDTYDITVVTEAGTKTTQKFVGYKGIYNRIFVLCNAFEKVGNPSKKIYAKVNIVNNHDEAVEVVVIEADNDNIDMEIKVIEGMVNIQRNMSRNEAFENGKENINKKKVYELLVEVYKENEMVTDIRTNIFAK